MLGKFSQPGSSPCKGEDRWGSGSAFELIEMTLPFNGPPLLPLSPQGERGEPRGQL
jgi:hypothetical protein